MTLLYKAMSECGSMAMLCAVAINCAVGANCFNMICGKKKGRRLAPSQVVLD